MTGRYIIGIIFLLAITFFQACSSLKEAKQTDYSYPTGIPRLMEPSAMPSGDPEAGFDYLIYGGHVGNGVPYKLNQRFFGEIEDTVLRREGKNGQVPFFTNVFTNEDGIEVVSGNCFVCHATELNGKIVLGLGNSFGNYTRNDSWKFRLLNTMVRLSYGKNSAEWKSYEEQGKWYNAIGKPIVMNNPGTNPAFRLEEATIAYRHRTDLSYKADPNFMLAGPSMGTDVPPLWNVHKKHGLYYSGAGRGDFTKLLMQVTLLGVPDSSVARTVQQHFYDVFAWMRTIEPPAYPKPINHSLAQKGQLLFADHCAKCHGTYGERETYPNKIIPMAEIGTDSVYAAYSIRSELTAWYNDSWLSQSSPQAKLVPAYGYIAPPLDGIWASSPYLHNGSVPTIADLLDSQHRPTYWARSGKSDDYDYQKLGWKYQVRKHKRGKYTFDTTQHGAANHGHTFGDDFRQEERLAVIEYLKTL
ncbi:MAG: hypothetical protein AAF587_38385 [Bacteroidota bacterium]